MNAALILSCLILLTLIFSVAIFQFSMLVSAVVIGIALLIITIAGFLIKPVAIVLWALFLIVIGFSFLKNLRIKYVIKPLLPRLKAKLPPISDTERAAIDAGDTWWERDLFCGRPDWNKLLTFPRPSLSLEEQAFLENQVEQLCHMINEWEIMYQDHDIPEPVFNFLKKEKFFAMEIPKSYGGLGFSAYAHSTVITKIATSSVSVAVTTMVPNSLGPGALLVRYGTEEQKQHHLPLLARGDAIPCFALTAPDAGSDAGAMPDMGIVKHGVFNGENIVGIELSWDKRYITLAPIATLLGLAIQLYDPDHLIGDKEDVGITLCLIPTSHPGVEVGARHFPMYAAFMNGPTRGKRVFIPLDWIIGGIDKAGQGWRMLMECLSVGRSISLPALATACGKVAYRLTGAYARVRQQFNVPIASFEGIEEKLAVIGGYTYLLEACRLLTVSAVDMKINPAIVSAIAKYHMTEMGRQLVNCAMDVHAGHMIQVGPRNPLANAYLASPISITVEGANILTRNLIIFGQGAIRCHPYLLKEIELMSQKEVDVNLFDQTLMSHLGYVIRNILRGIAYGVSGGRLIGTPFKNRKIHQLVQQLNRMSTALAIIADVSLILLGGQLKRKERTSARLGDILSNLYLASAVIKYYHDHQKPHQDKDYLIWSLQHCLYEAQKACHMVLVNYPIKGVGRLLKGILFPFGMRLTPPSDHYTHKLVEEMTSPNELRDRLTRFTYIKKESLISNLDEAIKQVSDIDPLMKKFNKGLQSHQLHFFDFDDRIEAALKADIITKEEAIRLKTYQSLRDDIIKVNEFNFDLTEVLA